MRVDKSIQNYFIGLLLNISKSKVTIRQKFGKKSEHYIDPDKLKAFDLGRDEYNDKLRWRQLVFTRG